MINIILWLSLYLMFSHLNRSKEAWIESNREKFIESFKTAVMSALVAAAAVICLMQGYK